MSVPYEKIVAEDLELGRGSVTRTMPAGGAASGSKINLATFDAIAFQGSRSSAQSVAASSTTTVQLDTEDLDTEGWFNPATYAFTPLVAGMYLFTAQLSMAGLTGTVTLDIYRGGTAIITIDEVRSAADLTIGMSGLATANGSTDAFTLRVTHTHASARNVTSARLSGILLGGV